MYLTYDIVHYPQVKRDGAVEALTQEPRVEQSEIRDSQRGEEQGHGPAGPPSRHRVQDDQGHAVPERPQEQDDGRADLPQGPGNLIQCQRLLSQGAVIGDGVFGSVLRVGVDRGLERDVEGSHDQLSTSSRWLSCDSYNGTPMMSPERYTPDDRSCRLEATRIKDHPDEMPP